MQRWAGILMNLPERISLGFAGSTRPCLGISLTEKRFRPTMTTYTFLDSSKTFQVPRVPSSVSSVPFDGIPPLRSLRSSRIRAIGLTCDSEPAEAPSKFTAPDTTSS